MSEKGLHGRLVEALGLYATSGSASAGSVMTIDDIERNYGASRSVVREAVRVLEAMGLVESRRRVGVLLRPIEDWNVFDPQVIRWRLASVARIAQLRSLTELRNAIEPEAARLAAIRAPHMGSSELVILASRLGNLAESGSLDEFLEVDSRFHALILRASGNEMFAKLDAPIVEGLTGRTAYGLMPSRPHADAVSLHRDVAEAIQLGAPDRAESAMKAIMARVIEEMSAVWLSE